MRRHLLRVGCVVGLSLFLLASPAAAQVGTGTETGTWVGQVVVHGGHFDYVGSPCPIEAEVCAEFVARYRIVPTTRQAFFALREAAGGEAALTGMLLTRSFGEHHGILFVSRVS